MICPNCGSKEEEGVELCSSCGAELASSPAGEETPDKPAEEKDKESVEEEPSPEEKSPDTLAKSGSRRRETTLFFALIGLAAIVAVVLVLVFVVFKVGRNEGNGAAGGSAEPSEVVQTFFRAVENGDLDSLVNSMDPEYIEELKAEYPSDYLNLIEGFFFVGVPEGLKITLGETDEVISGDQATVTILSGTVSYVDENGEEFTEDITQGVIEDFEVVRKDGKWFVSMATFPDWWYYLESVLGGTDGGGE